MNNKPAVTKLNNENEIKQKKQIISSNWLSNN